MKTLLMLLFFASAAFAANPFKEVICWNSGGSQILKVNAQKVWVEKNQTEIYLKASSEKPDYVVIGGTCLVKRL